MTPWFPFFGRDFLAATTGWTAEERGHYLTLLIVQWEQGSLPDDPKRLELISPGLKGCWKTVSDKFPVWKDGRRRNTRLEHERSKSHERSERARQSASQRWASESMPSGDGQPDAAPPDCPDGSCDGTCDRICDRTSTSIAPMSMLNSPPPPPSKSATWEQDWPTLRAAWNAEAKAGRRATWRSSSPPAGAGDRLQEDGWLAEALKAIPMVAELKAFENDVTLGQFCQPGWVAKILGGYWRDKKREHAPARPGPRGQDERRPAAEAAAEWQRKAEDPEAARRRAEYVEAKARKAKARGEQDVGRVDGDFEAAREAVLQSLRGVPS
jgi:uncharacterized protein YdaU (DUF1376 family)